MQYTITQRAIYAQELDNLAGDSANTAKSQKNLFERVGHARTET